MKDEDIVATIPGWSSYKFHYLKGCGPVYDRPYLSGPDIRFPRWLCFVMGLALGLMIWWFFLPTACHGKQTQPDAKRVHEIQSALIAYGCAPGKTWAETREILKGIARDRHWQTHYAPDARVLILLGLGNGHSDPQVLDEPKNKLDGGDPDE